MVAATGLVVAPGFIDWHVHGQNTLADRVAGIRWLEFEAGMLPINRWYYLQARSKRVLNYGASSSWESRVFRLGRNHNQLSAHKCPR